MATMISTVFAPLSSVSNLRLQNRYRHLPTEKSQSHHLQMNNLNQYKSSFVTNQTSHVSFTKAVVFQKLYASMDSNKTPPPAPSNVPQPNLSAWIRWIVGVIVSLVQPFWKFAARGKLLALGRQIEDTVEMVEDVVEIVEDVAEEVEKVSSELGKKLPEDGLKDAVTFVGNISKEVADDAEDAIEFIDKFEKVKEELESIVEDVVEGKCDAKEGEGAREKVKDVQMNVEATVEVTSEEETE